MDFLLSTIGQYFWQTILHSCLIAIIIEVIIRSSRIRQPSFQIKLRSLSLWLPIVYLPTLYFAYPPRANAQFRLQAALFDSNQWLGLRLWGDFALWHLAAATVAVTVIFFLLRELVPIIQYWFRRKPALPVMTPGQFPGLDTSLARLVKVTGLPAPEVLISTEAAPAVYTVGRRTLVLSRSAIHLLDADELEAVIAHELAHFTRGASLMGLIYLALRLLMFYNPAALLVFHRINHDTERLCDDLAVSFTGKRLALVSGLLKILQDTAPDQPAALTNKWWSTFSANSLEDRAHLALAQERAARILNSAPASAVPFQNRRVAVAAALLMVLLFFVV